MPDRDAYSLAEAAKRLGVSKSSVERLLRNGDLQAVQYHPGGHRHIRTRDLDAWLDGLEQVPVEGRKVA